MNCRQCQSALPDLFLDPASSSGSEGRAHLDSCPTCKAEFASLRGTFDLLDLWQAPEPSAYFDQRLAARLREAQALPSLGWFERVQSYFLFNTGHQFRPVLAGALGLVLLVGGGTAANVSGFFQGKPAQASATVQDLQILDRNDQAIQTMDQLLQDDSSPDEFSTTPTS